MARNQDPNDDIQQKYGVVFQDIPEDFKQLPRPLQDLIPDYVEQLTALKTALETEGLTTRERTALGDQYKKQQQFLSKVETAVSENDPQAIGLSKGINLAGGYLGPRVTQSLDLARKTLDLKPFQEGQQLGIPTPVTKPTTVPLPSQEPSLIGQQPQPLLQPGSGAPQQPQINPGPIATTQPFLPGGQQQPPQPLIPQQGVFGSTDVPTVRREISETVKPGTDRALVEQEAVRQQDQQKAIAEAQAQAYLQSIGAFQQRLSGQQGLVEQEAQRQNQQIRGLGQEIGGFQQQRLNDLGSLLNQRQSDLFQRATPQLAEQAQTAGLLQSSGFGEALARNFTDLTADTQFQLGQQGLADRDLQVQLLQQGLGQQQQLQGAGLELGLGQQQDIAGKFLGADEKRIQDAATILGQRQQLQLSGLQRQFSTDDLKESARLAQLYGLQVAPQSSGGNVFGSLLGGVGTGASAGFAIGGPAGAGIGAAVGGIGGLLSGKKGK